MHPPEAVYCVRCREVVKLNVESRCEECGVEINPWHQPQVVEIKADLEGKVTLRG